MTAMKLLGSLQCFGEEEVVEDRKFRSSRVVVTQQAVIYSISK